MKILLTGGAGYIGSHTAVELLNEGFEVVIVDNLSNSKIEVIDFIKEITGKDLQFYQGDVCDKEFLTKVFDENKIEAVIHFAGLKAVGESCEKPIEYYRNNIDSTLTLVEVMNAHNCKNIIFSSSATVYGLQDTPKCVETMKKQTPSNPYGKTKAMIEEILKDLYDADNEWSVFLLRYFNPVGAHESGLIGDNPNGIPNNLMPYVLKVAAGKLPKLTVFGNDYETPDGTCIRDFIHVVDLAKAHIAGLKKMLKVDNGTYVYNLGSNKGVSVQELIDTFERVNNIKLNYEYGEKRKGDLAILYADATKALEELNWKTEKTIEDMCRDSWNFAKKSL